MPVSKGKVRLACHQDRHTGCGAHREIEAAAGTSRVANPATWASPDLGPKLWRSTPRHSPHALRVRIHIRNLSFVKS